MRFPFPQQARRQEFFSGLTMRTETQIGRGAKRKHSRGRSSAVGFCFQFLPPKGNFIRISYPLLSAQKTNFAFPRSTLEKQKSASILPPRHRYTNAYLLTYMGCAKDTSCLPEKACGFFSCKTSPQDTPHFSEKPCSLFSGRMCLRPCEGLA